MRVSNAADLNEPPPTTNSPVPIPRSAARSTTSSTSTSVSSNGSVFSGTFTSVTTGSATSTSGAGYIINNRSIVPRSCITPASTAALCNSSDYFTHQHGNYTQLPSPISRKSSISEFNSDLAWLHEYNTTLDSLNSSYPQIKCIKSSVDLNVLLDFYYEGRFNFEEKKPDEMFPYLHGLSEANQRFFSGPSTPEVSSMNLMFINLGDGVNLRNTVDLVDLLGDSMEGEGSARSSRSGSTASARSGSTGCATSFGGITSAPFSDFTASTPHQNNRNYLDQIKLMAPYSSFVIYNYSNNVQMNNELAILLNSLKHPNQFVYTTNVNWNEVAYKEETSSIFDNALTATVPYNKGLQHVENPAYTTYLNCEQNLIWKLNSKKWLNRNICVGNKVDFNDTVASDFKLLINCNDYSKLPSLHLLNQIYNNLNEATTSNVYYFEFPSSGSASTTNLTNSEILSFLNTLKLMQYFVKLDYKIFIYSSDGFTGSSLLTIAINQLLNHNNYQDSILQLAKSKTKLYYFKSDLYLLKNLESDINSLKSDISNSLIIKEVNFSSTTSGSCNAVCTQYDWFNLDNDNNMPSFVMPNVYLGSLNHANSKTILSTIGVTHLISIGECPSWVKSLSDTFVFDFQRKVGPRTQSIKPIYIFNNGESRIYHVDLTKFPPHCQKRLPTGLKSFVFIHNLKDDGRDSILPLLIDCPFQDKFLPNFGGDVTLIHCRIGVSRSASLLIASMMLNYKVDLLTAYMFLRVQRFNIIIQPNLRIFYELFLYQDYLKLRGVNGMNWEVLCCEIHRMNDFYIE